MADDSLSRVFRATAAALDDRVEAAQAPDSDGKETVTLKEQAALLDGAKYFLDAEVEANADAAETDNQRATIREANTKLNAQTLVNEALTRHNAALEPPKASLWSSAGRALQSLWK